MLDMMEMRFLSAKATLEARLSDLQHAQEELKFIPACWRGDKVVTRNYKAARMRDVLARVERYKAAKAAYEAEKAAYRAAQEV